VEAVVYLSNAAMSKIVDASFRSLIRKLSLM